jgi:hypothetical protein
MEVDEKVAFETEYEKITFEIMQDGEGRVIDQWGYSTTRWCT